MFGPKIKLDKALYERAKHVSEVAGYSSVDEFVAHVLERELDTVAGEDDPDDEEVLKRLKGLGYL